MVRAFLPQTHHGNILFNTDFPPQSDKQQGFIPVEENMIFNEDDGDMLFNNTGEIMIYNDN